MTNCFSTLRRRRIRSLCTVLLAKKSKKYSLNTNHTDKTWLLSPKLKYWRKKRGQKVHSFFSYIQYSFSNIKWIASLFTHNIFSTTNGYHIRNCDNNTRVPNSIYNLDLFGFIRRNYNYDLEFEFCNLGYILNFFKLCLKQN